MHDRRHVGLDHPTFEGRLRHQPSGAQSLHVQGNAERPSAKYFNDIIVPSRPRTAPRPVDTHRVEPAQVAVSPVRSTKPTEVGSSSKLPKFTFKLKKLTFAPTQLAVLGLAVLLFSIGLFVSISTWQTNHAAKAQVAALSQQSESGSGDGEDGTSGSAVPSETKPNPAAISSYHVATDLPRSLKIPKLSVSARIKPLSVDANNQLKAPANIYDTGWYNASAKPGDPGSNGAMLIDGHVHGPTLPGVFVNIKKLVTGDTIQVVRGDGKTFTYSVVKVQNYDANTLDMGMMLTSIKPGEPGLNLITCGGQYDTKTHEYEQRTAVFAVLRS